MPTMTNSRSRAWLNFLLMPIFGVLFGYVWWVLNQDKGNLAVVDHYFPPGSAVWWALSALLFSLSIGLLYLQLVVQLRPPQEDDGEIRLNKGFIAALALLSTVIDIPLPSYGFWLSQGLPPTLFGALFALVISGIIGSTICQVLAVAAWVEAFRAALYLFSATPTTAPVAASKHITAKRGGRVKVRGRVRVPGPPERPTNDLMTGRLAEDDV